MKIHFIAIGGSAMHNLAIALHKKGYQITGSDDEIFEPSKGRLAKYGLLPEKMGWNPGRIHEKLDGVILGMHARADNPELLKARELGVPVYSYPEYIYEQSKDKTRVVIGGSHGKTSITAMILHVLHKVGRDVDYLVGAQLEGFETMVKITSKADTIILEGDEYLSSPIDRRPKFHLYHPHIAVISGIAWDHINVFPTFEEYVKQFEIFSGLVDESGALIYYNGDDTLRQVCGKANLQVRKIAYDGHRAVIENYITNLVTNGKKVPVQVFGDHNMQNISAAYWVCSELGISDDEFYESIKSFKGAARRLELVAKNDATSIYKDFAHSPSKLKATTKALKEQYPDRKLTACMELHTFSSLNRNFLQQYKGAMDAADEAIVYFNPHTIEHKKLEPISIEQVKEAFANEMIRVYTDSALMLQDLLSASWKDHNLLMMTSGNFDGIDFGEVGEKVVG